MTHETTWWVIKRSGFFLSSGSKHRGTQGGYARIWTEEQHNALHYISRTDAESAARKEFQDYEMTDLEFVQVH